MKTVRLPKLFIVIPAYNEAENVSDTVQSWYPIIEDLRNENRVSGDSALVIVDDGSTDDTPDLLHQLSITKPNLIVLRKPNGGHGPAVIHGYEYSLSKNADWIFQTDADGQTNPEEFLAFWDKKDKFDLVIGFRPVRGDGKARAIVEKVVCILVRMFFRVRVPDANAPFRLMKANVLAKYLPLLPQDYNLPNVVLTAFFASHQEKLVFMPISFAKRLRGGNSMNFRKIIKIGINALLDFRRFGHEFRS